MARKGFAAAVLAAVLVAGMTGPAMAQRGRRNFTPITPFGPVYDPTTMRQAGGNPMAYQQLLEQKMMLQQQQTMMRQQQAMMRQAQQSKAQAKKKTSDKAGAGVDTPAAPGTTAPGNASNFSFTPTPKRKSRRPTPSASAKTATTNPAPAADDSRPPATGTDATAPAKPKLSQTRGVSKS